MKNILFTLLLALIACALTQKSKATENVLLPGKNNTKYEFLSDKIRIYTFGTDGNVSTKILPFVRPQFATDENLVNMIENPGTTFILFESREYNGKQTLLEIFFPHSSWYQRCAYYTLEKGFVSFEDHTPYGKPFPNIGIAFMLIGVALWVNAWRKKKRGLAKNDYATTCMLGFLFYEMFGCTFAFLLGGGSNGDPDRIFYILLPGMLIGLLAMRIILGPFKNYRMNSGAITSVDKA